MATTPKKPIATSIVAKPAASTKPGINPPVSTTSKPAAKPAPVSNKVAATVYDAQGNLLPGAYVEGGKTYLSNGERIKPGMVVNVNGKTFRMDADNNPNNNKITADDFNNIASLESSVRVTEGAGGVSGNNVPVIYPNAPNGGGLARDYNITQDRAELEKLLTSAVDAKYAQLNAAHKRTEDAYYDSIGKTQDTVLSTLRKGNMNAITSGASKGVQAANELAAVLGLSQAGADGATTVAQAGSDLALNHATDLALAKSDALTTSNDLGKALAQIGSTFYNSDVVRYGSELNHNAAMDANMAGLMAQKYASDQALKGQLGANASQITAAQIAAAGSLKAAQASAAAYGKTQYPAQSTNPFDAIFAGMSKDQQKDYMLAVSSGNWEPYTKKWGLVSTPVTPPGTTPPGSNPAVPSNLWNLDPLGWSPISGRITPDAITGAAPNISNVPPNSGVKYFAEDPRSLRPQPQNGRTK